MHAACAWEAGTSGRALQHARSAEDRHRCKACVRMCGPRGATGQAVALCWPACRSGANPHELLFQGQTVMPWTMVACCAWRVRWGVCGAACTRGPGGMRKGSLCGGGASGKPRGNLRARSGGSGEGGRRKAAGVRDGCAEGRRFPGVLLWLRPIMRGTRGHDVWTVCHAESRPRGDASRHGRSCAVL